MAVVDGRSVYRGACTVEDRIRKTYLKTVLLARSFNYGERQYLQRGIDLNAEHMKNRFTRVHSTNLVQTRWRVG
jgi:hypothetical protein